MNDFAGPGAEETREAGAGRGFAIGAWVFDAGRQCLVRGGVTRPLNPKDASVLSHLAEAAPAFVSREDLLNRTWAGVVVGDHVVHEVIGRLRRALGDNARRPAYIETLPKRGYRLMVAVRPLQTRGPADSPRRRGEAFLPALLAAAALLVVGLHPSSYSLRGVVAPASGGHSLMVLPLTVTGPASWADDYASGLVDEVMSRVAGYQEVRAMFAPGTRADGTAYLVRGSVQPIGGRLRVRVALVRARDGYVVWSSTHTEVRGERADPVPHAARIARMVRLQLTRDQQCESVRRRSRSSRAADLICAAQAMNYRINQQGQFDPALMRAQLERAIALDERLVEAHQLLPTAYYFLAAFGRMTPERASELSHLALARARALDPGDAVTLWTLGFIQALLDFEYDSAEANLRAAITNAPMHPNARWFHAALAMVARRRGDLGSALDHYRRALRIYDSDGRIHAEYAETLFFAGEHRAAIEAARAAVQLSPYALSAYTAARSRFRSHLALDQRGAALAVLDAYLATADPEWKPHAASMMVLAGRSAEAQRFIETLEAEASLRPYPLSLAYLALGEPETALEYLELGIEQASPVLLARIKLDPAFHPLRNDPRWGALMRRLGARENRQAPAT